MEPRADNPQASKAGAWQYVHAALAIVLVLGASAALRLYPTLASPSLERMVSLPVLSEYDGYYFLRYAKEYCAGTYAAGDVDTLRGAHNDLKRPPLPLLSAAVCLAHRATGYSLDQVALLLPVLLSALVPVPIWLYRRRIGGELAAAAAIVFTLTSPAYVLRTKAGFLDTDCLIPFFFLMVLLLLHKCAETQRWKGVLYAVAAGLLFRLFMMWYPKGALFYIFGAALMALLALYWRGNGLKMGALKLLSFMSAGYTYYGRTPLEFIQGYFSTNVIISSEVSGLPNVAASVSELAAQPIWVRITQVHLAPLALAGAAGIVWLIWSRRRDAASLLPVLVLGALGFVAGMRYLIYLVPVAGMGFGFLVVSGTGVISEAIKKRRPASTAAASFAVAVIVSVAVVGLAPRKPHEYDPIFNRFTVEGFLSLRQMDHGLVWNWWDHGYAIQDISGQSTYVDGGVNNNAYYVSLSLVQVNQRHTYNIIRNVLGTQPVPGFNDMERLRAEPQPGEPDMPVYIALTNDMIDKHRWINYYGNWDFKSGSGDSGEKLWYMGTTMNNQAQGTFATQRGQVDLAAGTAYFQNQVVLLRGVHRASGSNPSQQSYADFPFGGESSFILELVRHATHTDVFLIDKDFYKTQFNRMLILGDIDPEYFELVYSDAMMTKVLRLK